MLPSPPVLLAVLVLVPDFPLLFPAAAICHAGIAALPPGLSKLKGEELELSRFGTLTPGAGAGVAEEAELGVASSCFSLALAVYEVLLYTP